MKSDKGSETGLEICINTDGKQPAKETVEAAFLGGADRIELCTAMHLDGCTPTEEDILAARMAFKDRPGLLVMIRPRGGDFCYSREELGIMLQQIEIAATAGANGVVFGALQKTGELDLEPTNRLTKKAKQYNLEATFHRAFDALVNPTEALSDLIDIGIDRILTSGTSWKSGKPATQGIDQIKKLLRIADKRIELVIGGGITLYNIHQIQNAFNNNTNCISIHAYSAALRDNRVNQEAIRLLKSACANAS